MKRFNRYGWLLAIVLLPAAAWSQDVKLAAVDMDQAVFKSAVGAQATEKLDAIYKEKTEGFDKRKKEIDEQDKKCSVQCPHMEPNPRTELQRKINDLKQKFQRDLEDFDLEFRKLRADTFLPIIKTAKEELNKMISERGYQLVLDFSGEGKALFVNVNDRINITEELTKRIETVIPAVGAVDGKSALPAESKPKP